jgi:hypothetical protein
MTDPNHSKPGLRPGSGGLAKPTSAPSGPTPSQEKTAPQSSGGRVVHDSRGNAIWQWVKEAGRAAIESTSTLLKKLETPELKVDDTKNNELRLESDVDQGGGYDPYGTNVGTRKEPPPKVPPRKR